MRKIITIAATCAALALAACSTGQVQTAQQRISDIQTGLTIAEAISNSYASLPSCAAGGPALCSDPSIVSEIAKADKAAGIALAAAAQVAATAGTDEADVAKAIDAAVDALRAYQDIAKAIKPTTAPAG